MFGYVVIDKPNILIKDYQTYQGYYCGLCKALGNRYGQLMRFTLNYDIVLLAMVGVNCTKTEPDFQEEHCITHPVGRKRLVAHSEDIFNKIADINIILGYYKVQDDLIDEDKNYLLKAALNPKFKKASKNLPEYSKVVEFYFKYLRELEKQEGITVEELSNCFGEILAATGRAITGKQDKTIDSFFLNLGKWIYIVDAIDDIKLDYEKGLFNPFLVGVEKFDKSVFSEKESQMRYLLFDAVDRIIQVYDKMDITITEGPLSNVVYRGLSARSEQVIKQKGDKKWQKIRL